ncbi:MAG: AbrB/MazE/SpoVT family DNA-binding domain-containing protein [Chloroflexi bacterium]|nr:AbrB/MazE/SpoVT family DNA-binding domain-containing protein [Chloroflexota bacterium]MYD65450.1 AbrB/MazE/SpoVT family DNA-binding domain-containing protein [Chloroflexota bacterium]
MTLVAWTKVDKSGRVYIPAEYRRELGLKPGDSVMVQLHEGELRIMSQLEGIRRAREIVARYVSPDRSLADELIAERRAEAARE